jgi:uncharacterized protein
MSRAEQRIDQTLIHLQRSGYVAAERPVGAPSTADPLYRLVDPYLRYWFAVLREDADLIDGGQGEVIRRRVQARWEAHVQAVFEEVARAHAMRMVAEGELPDAIIGRWWKDEVVQVDVVGLDAAGAAVVVGEAKWQQRPFEASQMQALRQSAAALPQLHPSPVFGVWSRHGVSDAVAGQRDVVAVDPARMFAART